MRVATVLFCAALTGCGVVYNTPGVTRGPSGSDETLVRVQPITSESVLAANRTSYQPQTLPAAFSQAAQRASTSRRESAPAPVFAPEDRPGQTALRPPPDVPREPYRIGVGDVVVLATPQGAGSTVEELSGLLAAQSKRQGYTVQDDGAIAVPDVGRIPIAGLTLEEAEAEVFQSLVENQFTPSFSIEVAEFNSRKVSVGGAVRQPTVIPITLTGLTIDQALSAVGGIETPDEDFALIRIYRGGTMYQMPLSDFRAEPDLRRKRLVAGDSVFVDLTYDLEQADAYFRQQIRLAEFRQQSRSQALSELNAEMSLRRGELEEARSNFETRLELGAEDRDHVYVTGEVRQQRRVPLPFGQTASLADVLFDGGGFANRTGDASQVYVLRGERDAEALGAITAWNLNAANAGGFVLATRFEMRPDDVIFVAEQPITRWNRVVQQLVPSLLNTGLSAAETVAN